MAKQMVRPGGVLDIPSVNEIVDPIGQRILQALGRNATFIRAIATGTTDGSGNFSLSEGPPPAFIWDIRWIQWSGQSGNMNTYITEPKPVNLLGQNFGANTSAQFFGTKQILIYGPDVLVFTQGSIATAVNTPIQVQFGAIQVPLGHEGQLLL